MTTILLFVGEALLFAALVLSWWVHSRSRKTIRYLIDIIDWLWTRHHVTTTTLNEDQRTLLQMWEEVHPYGERIEATK